MASSVVEELVEGEVLSVVDCKDEGFLEALQEYLLLADTVSKEGDQASTNTTDKTNVTKKQQQKRGVISWGQRDRLVVVVLGDATLCRPIDASSMSKGG